MTTEEKIREKIHYQLQLNVKLGRIDGTLEDALVETCLQERLDAVKETVQNCWYAILDFPHDNESGFMENLDLDEVYLKFNKIKEQAYLKKMEEEV
jgi:hypothetical protein